MGCGTSKTVPPDSPAIGTVRTSTDAAPGAKGKGAAGPPPAPPDVPSVMTDASQPEEGGDTRPADHISQAAVSLDFLRSFVEQHKLRERGLTTAELVAEIVKPATEASRCRFADTLIADPATEAAVCQGRPFFFVSHVWNRPFIETVDMLAAHFEEQRQLQWRRMGGQPLSTLPPQAVFLWLDVFAINQHDPPAEGPSDLGALWEAMQDAQSCLLVVDPAASLLSRTWCLYEAWLGRKTGPNKLRLLTYGVPLEALEQAFLGLNVAASKASLEADRERLLEDVRRDVGSLEAMTKTLKDGLVAAAAAQAPPEDAEWNDATRDQLLTAGRLCELYDRLPQAEALYRQALDACEATYGPDHEATQVAVGRLAHVLRTQGNFDEAEPLYRQALERNETVHGREHPTSLEAVRELAEVLEAQGSFEEAEPTWRRALEGAERALGPHHATTLGCVHSLAAALAALDRYDDAEPLYLRALEGREKALGGDHLDTLGTAHNLAYLYMSSGKYDEAEPLFRRALEGRERALGPEHADTVEAQKNLLALLRIKNMLGGDAGEGGDG